MEIRYFDNAATTKVKEEVLKEMFPYFSVEYGNPSSMYSIGRSSRRAIETARKRVAELINCKPKEIYFTSCGSESDNMALKGIAYANKEKGNHIITSKIEHPAILNSCKTLEKQGYRITYLNVDEEGNIDISELENSINEDTILISIMFANNEIGTIEPIEQISKIAKKHNIIFHTDAVQACGNIKIDVKDMGIDMLSLSGHKINAPKGVGALYVREGIEFDRFLDGGHQEKNKRAGTENVAEIVGLGKACEIAKNNLELHTKKLKELRDFYINQVEEKIENIKLNGPRDNRLPGNANISFKGINGSELLLKLDEKGICASAGSACSTGSSSPSHVLTSIGLDSKMAEGTLRVSFGEENSKEDVEYLVENLKNIVRELRKKSNFLS
ncbi:MAG: cysteine desulfurase NifS [Clostridia bacterium]|nr:cysteine desulfurase NifS [Clostridium sp.]